MSSEASPERVLMIGPMAVGKTTTSALLAKALALPHIELDTFCQEYYDQAGFDLTELRKLRQQDRAIGSAYMHRFLAGAAVRLVQDHATGVLDFGAGHVIHQDPEVFGLVEATFTPFPNVVLLVPSPDPETSYQYLNDRILARVKEYGDDYRWAIEANRGFITDPSNLRLAKIVVYTMNKSPEQVVAEIIDRLH